MKLDQTHDKARQWTTITLSFSDAEMAQMQAGIEKMAVRIAAEAVAMELALILKHNSLTSIKDVQDMLESAIVAARLNKS